MSPDTKYHSLEGVAELLGVTYQLIYRLVRSGELPAVRIGRVYRVAAADLDAYLEKSKAAIVGGGMCSVCGKTYASGESLRDGCEECGAPICTDCRMRLGVSRCPDHSLREQAPNDK